MRKIRLRKLFPKSRSKAAFNWLQVVSAQCFVPIRWSLFRFAVRFGKWEILLDLLDLSRSRHGVLPFPSCTVSPVCMGST